MFRTRRDLLGAVNDLVEFPRPGDPRTAQLLPVFIETAEESALVAGGTVVSDEADERDVAVQDDVKIVQLVQQQRAREEEQAAVRKQQRQQKMEVQPALQEQEQQGDQDDGEGDEDDLDPYIHLKEQLREFWMPDKLCKVCYGCEETFTMYRRRHHCRMCGQIFCNPCSSHYIDGALINLQGLVRSCRLCHDQLLERTERENKHRRWLLDLPHNAPPSGSSSGSSSGGGGGSATVGSGGEAGIDVVGKPSATTQASKGGKSSQSPVLRRGKGYQSSGSDAALSSSSSSSASSAAAMQAHAAPKGGSGVSEPLSVQQQFNAALKQRASEHLQLVVDRLISTTPTPVDNAELWKSTVVALVGEVVASVDPNVRRGDSLDIRPYVKIKTVPGGSMDENAYIDGVVFRKNVSHKKMIQDSTKLDPKILLLAGGIEFQRTDARLSSMDTLIEQEDRYLEILVDKIMSLKPDIILVGKAVARKAQELLCNHSVVVMQSVKPQILERISRVSGAMMLPSTDHMIQQYGEECLGSCGRFWLRLVQDDPERYTAGKAPKVLHNSVTRGSTYAYLEGCPPQLGCTIVLRGASKTVLKQIKEVIRFGVVVAYHLRLEVAYYNDRSAQLVPMANLDGPGGYDEDESGDDGKELGEEASAESKSSSDGFKSSSSSSSSVAGRPLYSLSLLKNRLLLSYSLDVDVGLPYKREIRGLNRRFVNRNYDRATAKDYQTLLFSSLSMSAGESGGSHGAPRTQRSRAEVLRIRYYTAEDIALGQFLIENCFHLSQRGGAGKDSSSKDINGMLDQVLSFAHRAGRIDVSVHRLNDSSAAAEETRVDPFHLPIYMSSYCKECEAVVTPDKPMSDETWKMSFGKFMEIMFYNRSARARTGGCGHGLRDCHVLSFACEGFVAKFDFVPVHPFSLHIRSGMDFPEETHATQALSLLQKLPYEYSIIREDFRRALQALERGARELLGHRPEDLAMVMSNVEMMEKELQLSVEGLVEEITKTHDLLLRAGTGPGALKALTNAPSGQRQGQGQTKVAFQAEKEKDQEDSSPSEGVEGHPSSSASSSSLPATDSTADQQQEAEEAVAESSAWRAQVQAVRSRFAMSHKREAFLLFSSWNSRIDSMHRYLDTMQLMLAQQAATTPSAGLGAGVAGAASMASAGGAEGGVGGDAVVTTGAAAHLSVAASASSPPLPPSDDDDDDELGADKQRATSGLPALPPISENTEDDGLYRPSIDVPSVTFAPGSGGALPVPASGAANKYGSTFAELERRTVEKAKQSRITKALARFLILGKESAVDDTTKHAVPLGPIGEGRLGLAPGRRGEVIPVHEDSMTSIIAYSLASQEYHDSLQAFLRGDDDDGDFDFGDDMPPTGAPGSASSASGAKAGSSGKSAEELSSANSSSSPSAAVAVTVAASASLDAGAESETEPSLSVKSSPRVIGVSALAEPSSQSGPPEGRPAAPDDSPSSPSSPSAPSSPTAASSSSPPKLGFSPSASASASGGALPGSAPAPSTNASTLEARQANERQLTSQRKSHIKHRFEDVDDKGNTTCKFWCTAHWAAQFEAVRVGYLGAKDPDFAEHYIRSLSLSHRWSAQGGKSGASFSKSQDERLVVKIISRVELQMFLDFAPAYFEYMAKAFYRDLPTVLCKILGVYTVRYQNKESGKRVTENAVVMENIFYKRNITRVFDLKGSSRARYVEISGARGDDLDDALIKRRRARRNKQTPPARTDSQQVLLDDNLMELTRGRPFPLKHRAKLYFDKAALNDTEFLSVINVVDYSILVGFDEDSHELVVGIIDYLRQYDFVKRMERMGKSVGMLTGQAEPTIIQPPQYCRRFTSSLERYFMAVPDKFSMG